MSELQTKKSSFLALAIVGFLAVAAIVLWAVTRKYAAEPLSDTGRERLISAEAQENSPVQYKLNPDLPGPIGEQTGPITGQQRRELQLVLHADVSPGATLQQIVDARRGWSPTAQQWYGRQAPDFALNDLQGKQHKLSDYKGRDVMIVFWATWCRFCTVEIPHLNLLDKRAADELKILAITNEAPRRVQGFVTAHNMTYTVLLDDGRMPEFYYRVPARGIPATAFIDPGGKIKFAVSGLLSLEDTKAIIAAER